MNELTPSADTIALLRLVARGREVAQAQKKWTLLGRCGWKRVRQGLGGREVLTALEMALRVPKRRLHPGLGRGPLLELFLHGTADTRVPP